MVAASWGHTGPEVSISPRNVSQSRVQYSSRFVVYCKCWMARIRTIVVEVNVALVRVQERIREGGRDRSTVTGGEGAEW